MPRPSDAPKRAPHFPAALARVTNYVKVRDTSAMSNTSDGIHTVETHNAGKGELRLSDLRVVVDYLKKYKL